MARVRKFQLPVQSKARPRDTWTGRCGVLVNDVQINEVVVSKYYQTLNEKDASFAYKLEAVFVALLDRDRAAEADALLVELGENWHLPRNRYKNDVLHSFRQWRFTKTPILMSNGWTVLTPYPLVILTRAEVTFSYDLIFESYDAFNKRKEDFIRKLLEQAQALESQAKAAGFKRWPPRLTPLYVERVGLAIYRRTVCRWSWWDIMNEYGQAEPIYNTETFSKTIRRWAKKCSIPLK